MRTLLRQGVVRQHPRALAASGAMVVALPLIQTALLVGLLKAEPWQALLGAEGLVIALLARGQLRRATADGRLAGFGIALLNAAALGAAGVALGGHLLWISGTLGMAPVVWLVFAPTRERTMRRAGLAFALLLLPLTLFCALARVALETSASQDPAERGPRLSLAWAALHLRGGNGTERALLRLRQAQAAFEARDYRAAYYLAHNGAFDASGRSRVPASAIGGDVLDSLMRLKAQAHYNATWDEDETIRMTISGDPLPGGLLDEQSVRVRWGW